MQDVAVKQLLHTGDGQMGEFVKVMRFEDLRKGGDNRRSKNRLQCRD